MRRVRHTFESRLNIVTQALNGCPLSHLERIYKTKSRDIRMWIRLYKLYGEKGLYSSMGNRFTIEDKERIVQDAINNESFLSLPELAARHSVSHTSLRNWVKLVKTHGIEALRNPSLTRRKPKKPPKMARPKKKKPTTELERLQVEVYRLRAENALLKKVKALVEERDARERMTGLKSSKN